MPARASDIDRETFLAPFAAAGYRPVEPAILQPAEVFLDLSGEDLGRRLYLTADADGRELCLRPELTIPVCLDHVASGDPARPGAYCYHGRVFRQRPGEPGEFVQAGVESIGRSDAARAEAEIVALALDCLARHGLPRPAIRTGDTGLFRAALDALDLPPAWRRRLARDFGVDARVRAGLAALADPAPAAGARAGVLAALAGRDGEASRALVEDLLALGGIETVGGRSVAEIADRFVEKADLAAARAPPERIAALRDLIAVKAAPREAERLIAPIAASLGPSAVAALETLAARHDAFAAAGVDLDRLVFDASFGRRLDYYAGLVFEMHDPARPQARQVVGGGRYDGMLGFLGAAGAVPAVGFSVWVDRLPGAGA